jgi:hypothetical protein
MWREPFAKRRCLVPASGLYEWPKPGHAISDTYSEEENGAPADCTEPLAVSGDLFGSAPKPARKAKTAKPIKRVFNITLTVAFLNMWHTSELIICHNGSESGMKMCVACRFLQKL